MIKNKYINNSALFLAVAGCPAVIIYLTAYILRGGFFVTLDYLLNKIPKAMMSYIPMLLIAIIITLIFRKVSVAYLLIGGVSYVGAIAHYFKLQYRNEPLWPSDIVFAGAAGDMVKEFSISLTQPMIEAIVMLLVIVAVTHIFTMPVIAEKYLINILLAFVAVIGLGYNIKNCVLNLSYYKYDTFSYLRSPADVYYLNTFHTAFMYYMNLTIIPEPENYTQEAIENYMPEYIEENNDEQSNPDIIFLLAESYFQPDKIFDLEFSEDISENYDEISKHAVYGNTVASKYGGGTGEMEFTSLNQINITMFSNAVSYMNIYGNDTLPSFVQRLKAEGYETYAMHAYTSMLYNRERAYSNMGVDSIKFIESYKNTDMLGGYISDKSNAMEIIDTYKKFLAEGTGENVFISSVSMQNHMNMNPDGVKDCYTELISDGYSEQFTDAMSVIASYQKQTDESLKVLFDYFSEVDREVVIIVYGDHQSYNIEGYRDFTTSSLNEMPHYSELSGKEKKLTYHTTPFIMWSNKQDMGGINYPYVSISNLYAIASHHFGLPAGRYEEYLYNQVQYMPVADGWNNIYMNADGEIIEPDEEMKNELYLVNYDMLFGERYSIN